MTYTYTSGNGSGCNFAGNGGPTYSVNTAIGPGSYTLPAGSLVVFSVVAPSALTGIAFGDSTNLAVPSQAYTAAGVVTPAVPAVSGEGVVQSLAYLTTTIDFNTTIEVGIGYTFAEPVSSSDNVFVSVMTFSDVPANASVLYAAVYTGDITSMTASLPPGTSGYGCVATAYSGTSGVGTPSSPWDRAEYFSSPQTPMTTAYVGSSDSSSLTWSALPASGAGLLVVLGTSEPPVIPAQELPDAGSQLAYSYQVQYSDGTAPLTLSLASGSLPAGLSMSALGVISGTCTAAAGTYDFVAQVSDYNSQTATRSLSITVPPLSHIQQIQNGSFPADVSSYALTRDYISGTYSTGAGHLLILNVTTATAGVDLTGITDSAGNTWQFTSVPVSPANGTTQQVSGPAALANSSVPTGSFPEPVGVWLAWCADAAAVTSVTVEMSGSAASVEVTLDEFVTPAPFEFLGAAIFQTTAEGSVTIPLTVPPSETSVAYGAGVMGMPGTWSYYTDEGTTNTGNVWIFNPTPTAGSISASFTAPTFAANRPAGLVTLLALGIPTPAITTTSLPGGTTGVTYSQSLAVTGGSAPYTWSVSSGALPAGLSLSSAGVISGSPQTAVTASFTVEVTDGLGYTATQVLSITAASNLAVQTTSLPAATPGAAYNQALAATGGYGSYAWSLASGALPAGLSLSATGVISGTTTASGAATFTVEVTDAGENTAASGSLSITIVLAVMTSSLPSGEIGDAYSETLAAAGGTGTGYTWNLAAGSLPAGLVMSPAGVIAGTPSAAGTSSFTARVTDSASSTAQGALSILVYPTVYLNPLVTGWTVQQLQTRPVTGDTIGYNHAANLEVSNDFVQILSFALPAMTAGTAYSTTLTAGGGSGSYAWAVYSGALPGGLTLSPSGTVSGTPESAGPWSAVLRVVDTDLGSNVQVFEGVVS